MRTKRRKPTKSTKPTYNIFLFIIIFLFSAILVFPTLTLLLTSRYRVSKTNDSSSNSNINLNNNNELNKNENISNNNSTDSSTNDSTSNNDNSNDKNSSKKEDKDKNKSNGKLQDSNSSSDTTIPTFRRSKNSNLIFKKNIKIYLTNKRKVLSLPIEDYIKGVVAAEMSVNFELDALKAQAVAARTYTYMCINTNQDGSPYYKDADLTDDYKQYQSFLTKDECFKLWPKLNAKKYWDKISKSVDSTKGEVLFYKNSIIYAAFHSNSGGRTEDGYSLTHEKYPYLKSVLSPGEETDPDYKSTLIINKDKFNSILKNLDNNYKSLPIKNSLKYIKELSTTPGNRVNKIKICNSIFTGPQLRSAFKLKSTNFKIIDQGKNIIFNVKGFGHGMGMSQCGADYMAKHGFKFIEILKHYYQGVQLERVY